MTRSTWWRTRRRRAFTYRMRWKSNWPTAGTWTSSRALELIRKDPDSRRIIVSAWNVGELERMALAPFASRPEMQLRREDFVIDRFGFVEQFPREQRRARVGAFQLGS